MYLNEFIDYDGEKIINNFFKNIETNLRQQEYTLKIRHKTTRKIRNRFKLIIYTKECMSKGVYTYPINNYLANNIDIVFNNGTYIDSPMLKVVDIYKMKSKTYEIY